MTKQFMAWVLYFFLIIGTNSSVKFMVGTYLDFNNERKTTQNIYLEILIVFTFVIFY